jgi:hypothetical protein
VFSISQHKDSELEVLNDIIMDLLGTEAYFEDPGYSPTLPDGVDTSNLYFLKTHLNADSDTTRIFYSHDKKIVDSLQSYYDSVLMDWYKANEEFNNKVQNPKIEQRTLVVIIGDSLLEPQKVIKENAIKNNGLKEEYGALIELFLNSKLEQKPLDYNSLTNTGRYKLFSSTSKGKIKPSEKFAWAVNFSRVVFNENKDEAILYVSLNCKGDCGVGKLLYLKKKSGRWMIDDFDSLWVS